jgi:hypothetical protein
MSSKQRQMDERAGETRETKKAYLTPQLQIYGDLREITKSVAITGAMDGATGGGQNMFTNG